jgi:hypothetical protein
MSWWVACVFVLRTLLLSSYWRLNLLHGCLQQAVKKRHAGGNLKKVTIDDDDSSTSSSNDQDASCSPVNHYTMASLRLQDNNSYFSKAFLDKNPTAVRACAICATQFGSDKYKVSSKTPIYACPNAHNTQHKCDYALCFACHSKQNLVESNGRARSRRRNADSAPNYVEDK